MCSVASSQRPLFSLPATFTYSERGVYRNTTLDSSYEFNVLGYHCGSKLFWSPYAKLPSTLWLALTWGEISSGKHQWKYPQIIQSLYPLNRCRGHILSRAVPESYQISYTRGPMLPTMRQSMTAPCRHFLRDFTSPMSTMHRYHVLSRPNHASASKTIIMKFQTSI